MMLRNCIVSFLLISFAAYSFAEANLKLISTAHTASSQTAANYVPKHTANQSLISSATQKKLMREFKDKYFGVWEYPVNSNSVLDDQKQGLKALKANNLYQYNFHHASKSWLVSVEKNMDLSNFHNLNKNAIIVKNTYLRSLPTRQPLFQSHEIAGQGYPFDTLQVSALWIGAPIKVIHFSKDKRWALIETHNVSGWILTSSLAFASKKFVHDFENSQLVAITKDALAIQRGNAYNVVKSHIGMLLPKIKHHVMLPVRNFDYQAELVNAKLDSHAYQDFPLKLTPNNISKLIQQMIGQPYGWGGLLYFRDCSLTVMDLYLPFGIVLPRNSQAQLTQNKHYDLSHLSDSQKLRLIKSKAKPFVTLLGTPSHIVIYLGEKNGTPYVFQDVWGAHTGDSSGESGRAILGKSAITPLTFGQGIPHVNSTLLDGLTKMASPLPR